MPEFGSVEPWQYEDRMRAVRVLTAMGESAAQIAVRLGVCHRTVQRYRARLSSGQKKREAA